MSRQYVPILFFLVLFYLLPVKDLWLRIFFNELFLILLVAVFVEGR